MSIDAFRSLSSKSQLFELAYHFCVSYETKRYFCSWRAIWLAQRPNKADDRRVQPDLCPRCSSSFMEPAQLTYAANQDPIRTREAGDAEQVRAIGGSRRLQQVPCK
jgi:hypothetical protein